MARIDLVEPFALRTARKNVRESLGDVLPSISATHPTDGLKRHPQTISELLERFAAAADFAHVLFGELCVGMPASWGVPVPGNHVRHVVGVRPRPEVLRLHTGRSVAGVENELSLWNRADEDRVRKAMCEHIPVGHIDDPVAVSVRSTRPVPASIMRGLVGHKPAERLFGIETVGPVRLNGGAPRVSVPAPPCVVSVAPSAPTGFVHTDRNGASSLTHIDTPMSVNPRPVPAGAGTISPSIEVVLCG